MLTDYLPQGLFEEAKSSSAPGRRQHAAGERAAWLAAVAAALRQRSPDYRTLPICQIIEGLARVHDDWARPQSPRRVEAVARLHAETGYAPATLDDALVGLFGGMNAAAMTGWLEAAGIVLGSLDHDNEPVGAGTLVFGPELTVVIASGNVPVAAVPSLVRALLLKSPCLVKCSSDEQVMLPLYARSVQELAPELASALVVTGWQGGEAEIEDAALAGADALIAYGSDRALESLRGRLPVHSRFVGYGHRISFSAVGRELLTAAEAGRAAALVAQDACAFDQQGCLSPQTVYVERGGELAPTAFAEQVAAALAELDARLPRRKLDAAEATAIHQYRAEMEMRAFGEGGARVWSSPEGTRWTVALDPNPTLGPCCLNRTVVLRVVDDLAELPRWIAGQRAALQSAGLGVGPARRPALARSLGAAGVNRITRLGEAQRPESALFHDGVNALAVLARFVRVAPNG